MLNKIIIIFLYSIIGILNGNSFELASVHSVSGEVTIYSKSKTVQFRKAIPGRLLYSGDRIDTGKNGICQIVYSDDNSFIRIGENSQVNFSSSGVSDIIDISFGSLYCQVGGASKNNFKIYTSIGHYISNNSKFWLESYHNQSDEIIVQMGQVIVSNQFSLKSDQLVEGDAAILRASGNLKADKFDDIELELLKEESNNYSASLETFYNIKDIPAIGPFDLIPEYRSDQSLLKKSMLSFNNYRYQYGQTVSGSSYFNIIPYYHRKNLKIGLSLPIVVDGDSFWNFNKFLFDLFDRIEYLDYYNSDSDFKVHIGSIENKTFGYGGLIHKYRNSQNRIADRRTGVDFDWSFGKKFVTLNAFISSIRDLSRGGGLMGYRLEMFMMESFPMKIGAGFVVDHNQYAEIPKKYVTLGLEDSKDKRRRISGIELDASYELIRGVNRQLNVWTEFDYLYFSDKITFIRNISPREKSGTTSFRTGFDFRTGSLDGRAAFIIDSPLMLSPFFSSTYDLERARNIQFSDSLYKYIDALNGDACALCEYLFLINIEDSSRIIPKEIFPIISESQNVYNTPGLELKMNWSFNEYGNFGFHYGMKMEVRDNEYKTIEAGQEGFSYDPKLFHTLNIEGRIGEKVLVGLSELTFLYSQYNSPSFFGFSDVFTTSEMGVRLGLRPMQFMRIILDMQMIHYDISFDGIIDQSSAINIEFRFSL